MRTIALVDIYYLSAHNIFHHNFLQFAFLVGKVPSVLLVHQHISSLVHRTPFSDGHMAQQSTEAQSRNYWEMKVIKPLDEKLAGNIRKNLPQSYASAEEH